MRRRRFTGKLAAAVLGVGVAATGGAAREPGAHAFVVRTNADHIGPTPR